MKQAQNITTPTRFVPYCVGDRVWLEAKNLSTTHPTAKLAPRRYGPFLVTAAISHTTYRLKLPPNWKIHNVLRYLTNFTNCACPFIYTRTGLFSPFTTTDDASL